MSENKIYRLRIQNEVIEVEKDIYLTFYQHKRKEKYQKERDNLNGLVYYHAIENFYNNINGEETVYDSNALSIEELVFKNIEKTRLEKALKLLTEEEYSLIYVLFYENKPERIYAKFIGISKGIYPIS